MRLFSALAVGALLVTAGLSGASPASATVPGKGTAGYCPDANGVTVVVDFQDLGGDTLIRCAPGPQANGVTAMQNAGLDLAGVGKYGLALICKIEGKPADQSCSGMPPENATWGFWTATDGGKWASSQVGVQGWQPPAGSFEGWSFAHDKAFQDYPPPRVAPVRKANAVPAADVATAESSSFPWGLVIGLVVLVVLVVAGVTVGLRRRRA
ncbi:hypothetical protein VSH64_35055 [Amycolatopsis rhabdoformis]|uniref:Uncharacterized protein n=1 Tax=Amycolatopsis rhabdoformis TaxID=1448059 RepID=A0ABZ1I2M4_9PSEU|nr:hypothetical protein [Amycolatopsis rhabdoformis]WSE28031.1 hypothetical protein VSH64_35055 [Amycolatopsis rhabdoformis]